jgi:RNA polymerase sigma-70 factor (ECF subfamily)
MNQHQQIRLLLLRIAENDDKEAFTSFFNLFYSRLINFSLFFLPSRQDAEDVVSEVMIKLLRQRQSLPKIPHIESYLYSAVKNQSINQQKKNKIRRYDCLTELNTHSFSDHNVPPLDNILEDELRQLVFTTIDKLPAQRRMIYKMIKDDGLKTREVAVLLELSEKTIKKHLELAIRDLRKALQSYRNDRVERYPFSKITKTIGSILLFYFFI